MRQPGKRFEQGQYAFQVSRECLTHLILLPRDSTEIRLQGQETKEGSKFFMCIFWLTLKTKFLMFFFFCLQLCFQSCKQVPGFLFR